MKVSFKVWHFRIMLILSIWWCHGESWHLSPQDFHFFSRCKDTEFLENMQKIMAFFAWMVISRQCLRRKAFRQCRDGFRFFVLWPLLGHVWLIWGESLFLALAAVFLAESRHCPYGTRHSRTMTRQGCFPCYSNLLVDVVYAASQNIKAGLCCGVWKKSWLHSLSDCVAW